MTHVEGEISSSTELPQSDKSQMPKRPRVAVIGAGISGLGAAYYLNPHCDVTVFEAAERIGGHTATIDITTEQGKPLAVDTGFIVFNDKTYPLFQGLMDKLGVAYRPTSMGFSFCEQSDGYEYSGEGLKTLFAQRKNLFNIKHWRMLWDIVRFNRRAQEDLANNTIPAHLSLEAYLANKKYGNYFTQRYLVPMAAAIWSKSFESVMNMSALFFVRFFEHHGLLNITQRPQWFVIEGGSRAYLKPLTQSFSDKIRLSSPVINVERSGNRVDVFFRSSSQSSEAVQMESFDHVIFACHSDQTLEILSNVTVAEKKFLGSVPYQNNHVVLHKDISVLPKRPSIWASWNYFRPKKRSLQATDQAPATLTYNMNILQGFSLPETYCVTLNDTQALAQDKILDHFEYAHPQFSTASVVEQSRWVDVLKKRAACIEQNIDAASADTDAMLLGRKSLDESFPENTWYCGAWCRNGFHEDGLNSAYRVSEVLIKQFDAQTNHSAAGSLRSESSREVTS